MTSPFSTARAAAILAATALIATGCTDAGDATSSSSTTAPVAIDYSIDAKPVWTFDPEAANPGTDYLSNPGDIALDGNHLVLAPLTNMPLTVVDLAAGSIVWTLKEFSGRLATGVNTRGLSHFVTEGGLLPIETTTTCFGDDDRDATCPDGDVSDAAGVAGLDLATGKRRWQAQLAGFTAYGKPGYDDDLAWGVQVAGVHEDVVVATAMMRTGKVRSDKKSAVTAYGLDARNGKTVWKRDGFVAIDVLGDAAIGVTVPTDVGPDDSLVTKGLTAITALDRRTGKSLWDITFEREGRIVGRSDAVMLLNTEGGRHVAVETVTGAVHDVDVPEFSSFECPRTIVHGDLICSNSPRSGRSFLMQFTDPAAPTKSDHPIGDGGVIAQDGERAFVATDPYYSIQKVMQPSYTARPDGTRTSELLPGTVVAGSDRWVVLAKPATRGKYQVTELEAYAAR